VTIPHKRSVMPYLAEMTASAQVIGAVNTIFVQDDGRLLGDNTDWIGVRNALLQTRDSWSGATALIVGAGGTSRAVAYALRQMGCGQVYIYNRTSERAEEIAELFGCTAVAALNDIDGGSLDLIVSTIPGSSNFRVPPSLLSNKPVVFDVSYIPKWTQVLVQGRDAG
jgi:shikimate dehydrogenase